MWGGMRETRERVEERDRKRDRGRERGRAKGGYREQERDSDSKKGYRRGVCGGEGSAQRTASLYTSACGGEGWGAKNSQRVCPSHAPPAPMVERQHPDQHHSYTTTARLPVHLVERKVFRRIQCGCVHVCVCACVCVWGGAAPPACTHAPSSGLDHDPVNTGCASCISLVLPMPPAQGTFEPLSGEPARR